MKSNKKLSLFRRFTQFLGLALLALSLSNCGGGGGEPAKPWALASVAKDANSGVVFSSVAVDSNGNAIVAGHFTGTVDFGGGALNSQGSPDIFIAKFAPDGTFLWNKSFGDSVEQRAASVAVDSKGNSIVTGPFAGTVDFGGGALNSQGNTDIFIANFDSDGNYLWSKSFGDSTEQKGSSVAVDSKGNSIVTGSFAGTVDFGGGALTSTQGSADIFIANFDSDGNHKWSKSFGDSTEQRGRSVAVDPAGNTILTGYFEGTLDLSSEGLGSFTSVSNDMFLIRLVQ